MGRQQLDTLNARVLGFRSGRSGGDPFGEDPIVGGADLEPLAPFVGDGGSGLEQEQAAAGIGRHDTAPQRSVREREKITLVVIAAQRELEAVLTGGGPMTSA